MTSSTAGLRFVLGILLTAVSFLSSAAGQAAPKSDQAKKEPLSEWSRQWLDEVVPYIITEPEKKVFLSLWTEADRGAFIADFWKKRDPNPATPENEFKLEYYKRIALANKFFGFSGVDGWRTDRGKIFILLGPPQDIQRNMNPAGSTFALSEGPQETWNYWNLPNPKLPYNLEFVFTDKLNTGNYVLMSGLKISPEQQTSLDIDALSVQFDLMEYLAEAQRNPYEHLGKVKEIVTTSVTYDLIPLKMESYSLRGAGKSAYVPLVIGLPSAVLTPKTVESQAYLSLNLLLNVSNGLGRMIYAKSKDLNKKFALADVPSLKDKSLQILTSLYLEPGTYQLDLLLVDNFSGKIGTLRRAVEVPDFDQGALALSDAVLFSDRSDERILSAEGKDLRSMDDAAISETCRVFRPGEDMGVFIEVYNLALSRETGRHRFQAEYALLKNGEEVARIPGPEAKPSDQASVRLRTSFRLKNFQPGEYRLRIKITDLITSQEILRDVPFAIADRKAEGSPVVPRLSARAGSAGPAGRAGEGAQTWQRNQGQRASGPPSFS